LQESDNYGLIEWKGNNWAFACDFEGDDLVNVQIKGDDCGQRCVDTAGCTHFTWTDFNGGTCWLKSYQGVKKEYAKYMTSGTYVCGVI
jgi:hypothetical protein